MSGGHNSTQRRAAKDLFNDRAANVRAAIKDLARAEDVPVSARHVCQACANAVNASGVSLYVISDLGLGEPVYITDPASELVAESQVTLGEGPATDALETNRAVLVADLTSARNRQRWPMFTPAALATGVLAVFAFPLGMGELTVGSLEIYRPRAGSLTGTELTDGLLFADAAMMLLIDRVQDMPTSSDYDLLVSEFDARWSQVHQATGMVSAQLESELTEAYLRLRAHAFATDRRLSDVATDVVKRRLRFTPVTDIGDGLALDDGI
jgi:GAF domain